MDCGRPFGAWGGTWDNDLGLPPQALLGHPFGVSILKTDSQHKLEDIIFTSIPTFHKTTLTLRRRVRTGAAITVVTNAASVDADAGSIRYVATVIPAPVLSS